MVDSAKAIGLRGVSCGKVRERFQDRDATRSGFRLLRSRPRRKHSRVTRRPRGTWNEVPMLSRSYKVLPTQETLDRLADRIERAYALRRSNWYRGCSTPRVWSAAATILWEAHSEDPTIPLDPELFVASQPLTGTFADPWSSLAQTEAGHRYKQNVRRIIRRLRTELKREIRLTEDLLRQGRTLSMIIGSRNARLSPLGLYIAAQSCGPPGPRRTPPARCHRATQLLPSLPFSLPGFPAGGTLPDGSVEPQRRSQGNLRASARNRLLQLELKSRRQPATCGQPVDSRS